MYLDIVDIFLLHSTMICKTLIHRDNGKQMYNFISGEQAFTFPTGVSLLLLHRNPIVRGGFHLHHTKRESDFPVPFKSFFKHRKSKIAVKMLCKFYAVLFAVFANIVSILCGETTPLTPSSYQKTIAQGFSTNWFKSSDPLAKYNGKNIEDIYNRGFRNVRLRSRADLYTAPYNNTSFAWFLGNLTIVVDKCLQVGVVPIISWIHHHAEAFASESDRQNYITWWTKVADHLKDKDYRLSYNLFTELGVDGCGSNCSESLRERPDKYNRWTSDVVKAIRATGGKNDKRILILGSPGKTAKDLHLINKTIYENDPHIMAEWHIYASGPNKKENGQKYWSGDGTGAGKKNVDKNIGYAVDYTKNSKLLTYLGAWMPTDNSGGSLNQEEVISFGQYFTSQLGKQNIPWSLNVLDRYYDTSKSQWITDMQDVAGKSFNMSLVLDKIKEVMDDSHGPSPSPTSPNASPWPHVGIWYNFLQFALTVFVAYIIA